ncbi:MULTISPECIES: single-stranded DNA-binding protein [Arthrobacter]|uniref:Single-stranded DNA-binding protein n=1 Tax=Arthrobacter terricola TaxID=2547396 RepID=A0A4V2ZRP9_9MICC|nr:MULTISPECIES: single-stranded DNA-binding protein [Arthrobacter]MBT8163076.1 single-stranded DNA-binding protein [Arthrobacter sp. GN70]TDF88116.1 single-stranded DNA-binding protein [Arthrobacter terricola]
MAGETLITVIGKVHDEPEIKFTDGGGAVTKLTVVTNPRKYNSQTNKWENATGKFWDCRAWNQGKMLLAENVANTLKKGDNVIVHGEIETRAWETQEGQKRRADQLKIETIGKDLRWHQAPANDVPAVETATDPGWGNQQAEPGWGNHPAANQGGWP